MPKRPAATLEERRRKNRVANRKHRQKPEKAAKHYLTKKRRRNASSRTREAYNARQREYYHSASAKARRAEPEAIAKRAERRALRKARRAPTRNTARQQPRPSTKPACATARTALKGPNAERKRKRARVVKSEPAPAQALCKREPAPNVKREAPPVAPEIKTAADAADACIALLDAPCAVCYPGRHQLLRDAHRESDDEPLYCGDVSDERRVKLCAGSAPPSPSTRRRCSTCCNFCS